MPFLEVTWSEYRHTIEYAWVNPEAPGPLWVFLHEGLGSVALWRGFPEELCRALGVRGLVFSRWGYGRSSPRPPEERWGPDFMHRQAQEFLPAFFQALDLGGEPLWFYGHSDGGSIALIYAATFPEAVGGLVAVAPHVFVEEVTLESIRRARTNYLSGDLRARLARYHQDPDSAFFGWNEAWLDPRFRAWDIRDLLPQIRAPILAIQCYGDEYGTMAQIEEIARLAPRVELCRLEGCGHSPHRDRPEAVIEVVKGFFRRCTGLEDGNFRGVG
ncbi:alpha/beta hydrolase [Thermus oshimai]|uniref:alpha/beta fold hydrolase n=1 Tax=Thermus oshimai TaxID=56957 RepID=UPI0003791EEB|nr:alpha/beta hydrolase [Thermus oshimai]